MVVGELQHLTLVTGPASSGKSLFAEQLVAAANTPVTYMATGPQRPDDPDWQCRLRRHRERRPPSWQCLEVGQDLSAALRQCSAGRIVLVDSLGTWVAGALALDGPAWQACCQDLMDSIVRSPVPLVLVGEEAGWGVVPATAIGGLFRQRLGQLLQDLMPCCDGAWLVLHGRALNLLAISQSIPTAPPP
jgi:adenosylcobinamide kinase/adenosylcobinamide-phosphate guanylyltransferase